MKAKSTKLKAKSLIFNHKRSVYVKLKNGGTNSCWLLGDKGYYRLNDNWIYLLSKLDWELMRNNQKDYLHDLLFKINTPVPQSLKMRNYIYKWYLNETMPTP